MRIGFHPALIFPGEIDLTIIKTTIEITIKICIAISMKIIPVEILTKIRILTGTSIIIQP